MERVRIPEDERKDFYLYVDEFQNFATDSFVNILSEARKYRLDLTIAHQYIGQLTTDTSTAVRDAVFGNVGTMITFRVGAADAEFLEQEYTPEFLQNDLIRLPNYNIYLKLMIDGVTSRPFSAKTIAPVTVAEDDKKREEIIRISRSKYAHTVKFVEDEINSWASNQEVPSSSTRGSSDLSNPQSFPKRSSQSSNSRPSDSTKLYDAVCSNCGKDTKVIFPPEPGRAVYCKNCLKKMKEQQGGAQIKQTPPTTEVPREPARMSQPRKVSAGNAALAGMGIEFEPSASPSQGGSPSFGKNIPIQEKSRNQGSQASQTKSGQKPFSLNEIMEKGEVVPFSSSRKDKISQKTPRKSVDLDDLRKALDESLANKPKNSEEELKERVEEEKLEDKVSEGE
jgi:CxxC-x17-CxxC domain-containing protein